MNKKITLRYGVIAEDDCDVDSVRVLVHRITGNENIGIKKFIGRGCGKIKRKCNSWASQLKQKGCSTLILVHDLDKNDLDDLRRKIRNALLPCPITKHLICIPVQELEAWLLSDPDAIKESMNLRKKPNIKGLPEHINFPKEYLGEVIRIASNGEKIYIHTKHNEKISKLLSIKKAKERCPSFVPFHDFIQSHVT